MAQDQAYIKSTYPLPAYNYRVTILRGGESIVISFAEVAGLNIQYEPVTYKHGMSFVMGSKIIPGMQQPLRLTMKRGVVQQNDFLYSWIHGAHSNPFFSSAKRDIVIDLCDEAGAPVIRWTVQSALPIKLDAPTFDANTNEVAIETIEFVANGLQVDYNP
jgi:phage tail-like protein